MLKRGIKLISARCYNSCRNVLRGHTFYVKRCFSDVNKYNLNSSLKNIKKLSNSRGFHMGTLNKVILFPNTENIFAYNIINEIAPIRFQDTGRNTQIINTEADFNNFLDSNWRCATPGEITRAFYDVLNYCIAKEINISNTKFDELVNGLLDNVEKLSVDELASLLRCLALYPQTESFKSHNFHDVWSALDDVCCWHMSDWDLDTLFIFADLWFKLHLGT